MNTRRSDGDRGAYAVMYAVLSVVLVGIASVVIDLAALRLDRRADRAAADAAAIAAAGQLGELGANASAACRRALDYVELTTGTTFDSSGCGRLPPVCDPLEENKVITKKVDGRQVTITWPVRDGHDLLTKADVEGSAALGADSALKALDPDSDGEACQRIAVEISTDHRFLFAGVFGGTGATTTSRSVALAMQNSTGDLPVPLVALRERACDAVQLIRAHVRVGGLTGLPGEIAVDADDSRCPGDPVIDLSASDGLSADRIGIFLLQNPSSYPSNIDQQPLRRGWQVTSRPWEDRYNCARTDPLLCGKPADAPTPLTYVEQWSTFASEALTPTPMLPVPEDPSDWLTLTGSDCRITSDITFSENVRTDCDDPSTSAEEALEISDANVIFRGQLVTHDNVLIDGGNVTFENRLAVGQPDERQRLEVTAGSFVTFKGSAAVSEQLSIKGGSTVEYLNTGAANTDRIAQSIAVDDATLTVHGTLEVVANFTLEDGAELSVDDGLNVGGDFATTGALATIGGVTRIVHELHIRGGSDITFLGTLVIGDDLYLSGAGTILRSPGNLIVQNGTQSPSDNLRGILVEDSACLYVVKALSNPSTGTCEEPVPSAANAGSVYVGCPQDGCGDRGGRLAIADGSAFLHRSFVFLQGPLECRDPSTGGVCDADSASVAHLVAPIEAQACEPAFVDGSAPTPECFDDLALWTNGPGSSALRIGGDNEIEGTVFAPGGDLHVGWSDDVELDHAQFVAQRLIFEGSGPSSTLTIRPDPERTTLIPQSAGVLIR